MGPMLDTRQDTDLPIQTEAHWPDDAALIYGTDGSVCSLTAVTVAGLNSTPKLSWTFLLVICLQALKVLYKHSHKPARQEGQGEPYGDIAVSLGGRSAASLAATYLTSAGCVELSGGSG